MEILKFRVRRGHVEEFVRRNEEVWTPALREQDGFIRREVLSSANGADLVAILVYWRQREDIEAFPADRQRELDRRMSDLVVEREQWVFDRRIPLSDGAPGGPAA